MKFITDVRAAIAAVVRIEQTVGEIIDAITAIRRQLVPTTGDGHSAQSSTDPTAG